MEKTKKGENAREGQILTSGSFGGIAQNERNKFVTMFENVRSAEKERGNPLTSSGYGIKLQISRNGASRCSWEYLELLNYKNGNKR